MIWFCAIILWSVRWSIGQHHLLLLPVRAGNVHIVYVRLNANQMISNNNNDNDNKLNQRTKANSKVRPNQWTKGEQINEYMEQVTGLKVHIAQW